MSDFETILFLRAQANEWRLAALMWQRWATDLLHEFGRQPLHGEHGDQLARDTIAQLVSLAPSVPRCASCGCFATRHDFNLQTMDGCADCECGAYLDGKEGLR